MSEGNNKRIEFIDLAKGVCIILVVVTHCGLYIPGLEIVRMPLYFLLSGLFFKTYGSLLNFTIKKINKNIIPYVFWFLIGHIVFLILKYYFPDYEFVFFQNTISLLSPFYSNHGFNSAIWFLLALFQTGIIFYILNRLIKKKIILLITIFVLFLLYKLVATKTNIIVPFFLLQSIKYLPFYFLGYLLKDTELLYKGKYDKYNIILIIVFTLVFAYNSYTLLWKENILIQLFMSVIGVLDVLLISKQIVYIPLISYFGRYSIVILCTHSLYLYILSFIFDLYIPIANDLLENYVTLLSILLLELPTIYLSIKYLGYVTAQKDLFKI